MEITSRDWGRAIDLTDPTLPEPIRTHLKKFDWYITGKSCSHSQPADHELSTLEVQFLMGNGSLLSGINAFEQAFPGYTLDFISGKVIRIKPDSEESSLSFGFDEPVVDETQNAFDASDQFAAAMEDLWEDESEGIDDVERTTFSLTVMIDAALIDNPGYANTVIDMADVMAEDPERFSQIMNAFPNESSPDFVPCDVSPNPYYVRDTMGIVLDSPDNTPTQFIDDDAANGFFAAGMVLSAVCAWSLTIESEE